LLFIKDKVAAERDARQEKENKQENTLLGSFGHKFSI